MAPAAFPNPAVVPRSAFRAGRSTNGRESGSAPVTLDPASFAAPATAAVAVCSAPATAAVAVCSAPTTAAVAVLNAPTTSATEAERRRRDQSRSEFARARGCGRTRGRFAKDAAGESGQVDRCPPSPKVPVSLDSIRGPQDKNPQAPAQTYAWSQSGRSGNLSCRCRSFCPSSTRRSRLRRAGSRGRRG